MTVEMRVAEIDGIELRVDGDRETKQEYVDGIGVVYGREVEIFDGYFEKIRAGAFAECFRNGGEIKSFFNHDPSHVLATTRSNPALAIEDTSSGLMFHAPIPDTTYGRDLAENLKRGNVRGASFAFSVNKEGATWTEDEKGNIHREITSATIYEVGPVTNPAYPQTTAKVNTRSNNELMEEARAYLEAAKRENELRSLPLFAATTDKAPDAGAIVESEPLPNAEADKRAININWLELKRKQLNLLERSAT